MDKTLKKGKCGSGSVVVIIQTLSQIVLNRNSEMYLYYLNYDLEFEIYRMKFYPIWNFIDIEGCYGTVYNLLKP